MINTIRDFLKERITIKKRSVRTVLYIILPIILSTLIYVTYNQYKNTIVDQQLQNMLGLSRSISQSIEVYVDNVVDNMKVITLDKEFLKGISGIEQGETINSCNEKLKAYYEAEKNIIEGIYFYDEGGRVLTQYPQGTTNGASGIETIIDNVITSKKTYIGTPYLNEQKNVFMLNIYEPIFQEGTLKGVLSVTISLDNIYERLIKPVKISEKGYVMIKDQYGTIIMHPVKEQVGMDVIETRKQIHPELDYKELESLIQNQLEGKEGTATYHSYWWGENQLKKVKKLNSYTPAHLGEYFWVVAVTMSYDEIQGPIDKFSAQIIGIVVIVAIIIYFFISALIRMKRNKEELEKETKYLKILNETSEQLRKKDAELYHSHKLKTIGTLTGGIAHDINNLLTPILGYSELLLMQIPEDNEYYEEVQEIFKASQKGKDLIEQILLFSRKDNGIVKVEPININDVTKETIKLVKAILPKKIVIKEHINEGCGYINANFTQIHQVIFNLCTNAYQAMKDNNGIIEISLSTVEGEEVNREYGTLSKEKRYVELIVKDNGCGMDEETKAQIFDPFFTTKDIGEGTGLGLFVVQNIIDKYGGAIFVQSEIGNGSCFKIYLPLISKVENNEKNTNLNDSLSDVQKILVVDDNEDVIKVLSKGLEHLGYEVLTETNSAHALKRLKLECDNINLVITDYMMPNLNGIEFAKAIREIKGNIGIILITGYMNDNDKDVMNSKFIDDILTKPIEIIKLSEAIKRVLNNHESIL